MANLFRFQNRKSKGKRKKTHQGISPVLGSNQQTRIIVLKPNPEKPKNIVLHSGESREVAKEMSEHQRDETLFSSAFSNGYPDDESSINKWRTELAKEMTKEISQQLRKKLGQHRRLESEVKGEDVKVLCTSGNTVLTKSSNVDDMKKLAMEIGALQAANNKLEKRVEFKKTKEILVKEREAAMKIDEREKKYEETNKHSDESLKHAKSMVVTLKTGVDRVKEKNSDIEAEKKILQQQPPIALLKEVLGHPLDLGNEILENRHHEEEVDALMESVMKENQDNNDRMSYWLSNTSALLSLLQKSMKPADSPNGRPQPRTSRFRRMKMEYHALHFKQQLTGYVEKIYSIIRDNLKRELRPLLASCIQAPRTSKGKNVLRSGRSFDKDSPSNHWQTIVDCLNTLLATLKENFVPHVLVQKIFTQTFSYMNVQLFNSLLLHRECCTFSNGEYVKSGLAKLELWCCHAKEEYAGLAWEELKHIRQSVGFLVMRQKYKISYDKLTNDLCPILSVQQLYRICSLHNPRSVSAEVLSSIRVLMTEDSNDEISSSFLLDDNSSTTFWEDELSSSLHVKEM